jgi:GNAT superfamily N-acetyltransferase
VINRIDFQHSVKSLAMHSGITIRPIRPDDHKHLLELHIAAILAVDPAIYSNHIKQSWMFGLTAEGYGRAVDSGEVFDIAVDARTDRPVAFCGCKGEEIYGLFVHPEAQGRGVGAELLRRGEARLRSWGVRRSHLCAALSGARFYARHGWTLIGVGHQMTRGRVMMEIARLEKALW